MVNDHNCYWGYDGPKYCRMCGHKRGCADQKTFRSVAARTARASGSPAASSPDSLGPSGYSSPSFSGRDVCIEKPGGEPKEYLTTFEYLQILWAYKNTRKP